MKKQNTPRRLAAKLKPAAEKMVKRGHPWVFSESIVKLSPEGKSGDLVILFDQTDNKPFAIGLYDADSPVRIKIVHRGGSQKIDSDFFKKKIFQAFQLRADLRKNTNAYRLIFGENDGLPGLITDVYDKMGVIKLYSAIWLPYLQDITEHIMEQAGLNGAVLRLSRNLQRLNLRVAEGDVLAGNLVDPVIHFHEFGVAFQADILSGHKTGFFLDHRANRHKVGILSSGKTVLDVFSYAGGFSVHALAGGAREVTSVDISEQALELAVKNGRLNPHSGKHLTIAGDAFKVLEQLITEKKSFDIVVIDPPSLAKSSKEVKMAKKKYAQLAQMGARLTTKGGLLLLASCSSRITEEEFKETHSEVFGRMKQRYQLEEFTGHDSDHPVAFTEGRYLKTAYYRIY